MIAESSIRQKINRYYNHNIERSMFMFIKKETIRQIQILYSMKNMNAYNDISTCKISLYKLEIFKSYKINIDQALMH